MAVNNNFLPKFDISNNLSNDMRKIEVAKALSTGWYKGKFHYHMKRAGCITTIGGKQYYTKIGIDEDSRRFLVKGTRGYHIAEVLRLIGFDNGDLDQLLQTWRNDGVDGLDVIWRWKGEMSPYLFNKFVENLRDDLLDVDTIEIEYELQKYKQSVYTTSEVRQYNTRESIYGSKLQWGSFQMNYTNTAWNSDARIFQMRDIITKDTEFLFGNNIKFKKAGVDVSANYSERIKNVVRSMIAYSGSDFMERISYSKTGEKSYPVYKYSAHGTPTISDTYISAVGVEVYNARIKSSFISDIDNIQYKRYTGICPKSHMTGGKGGGMSISICEEKRSQLDERTPLDNTRKQSLLDFSSTTSKDLADRFYYTKPFWDYSFKVDESNTSKFTVSPIRKGDEFLFIEKSKKQCYIDVKAFKKLTMEEVGFYLGNYFNIDVSEKSGGGFFSGFVGALAGFFGMIFDLAFNIIEAVPVLKWSLQIMTLAVNKLFGSELTEKEFWQIGTQVALVVLSVLLAPETGGTSLGMTSGEFAMASTGASIALSLGVAGSKANDAKNKAERESRAKEKEQKNRLAEKELQSEEDKKKQKLDGDNKKSEAEEFNAFLANPLYKVDRERNKMKDDFKSQFKLL